MGSKALKGQSQGHATSPADWFNLAKKKRWPWLPHPLFIGILIGLFLIVRQPSSISPITYVSTDTNSMYAILPWFSSPCTPNVRTRPLMPDPLLSCNKSVPSLVYEEAPEWHNTTLSNWSIPYALVARHVPERNWLVVFTQGFNRRLRIMHDLKPPPGPRYLCFIGGYKFRFVKYPGALLEDMVICDLTTGPRRKIRAGDHVTVGLRNGKILPSIARYVPISAREPEAPQYHVCAYTQIKDQAHYIRDWVDYHKRIGIGHFMISDNNSTDNIREMFRNDPDVDILYWPWKKSQAQAYVYGRTAFEQICQWTLFMDLDQYIFVNQSISPTWSLPELVDKIVKENPNAGQICMRNKVYGSSGHLRMPVEPVPEVYIHTNLSFLIGHPVNEVWQPNPSCMTRLGWASYDSQIHFFSMNSPKPSIMFEVQASAGYFNHYSIRSFEDFIQKYQGRNGLVKDWDNATQKFDINEPTPYFLGLHGQTADTLFRDVYRQVMGDRNLSDRPITVPYEQVYDALA